MSQIAAALAKSKGKQVTPPPPDASVIPSIHVSQPPMPLPFPAEGATVGRKRRWPAIGLGLLVTAGIAWAVLRPKPPPPAPKPVAVAPRPIAAPPPKSAAAALPPSPPADSGSAAAAALPEPFSEPLPELQTQVLKFVITARKAGLKPRIVIGGKMYHPGDPVTAELTLQEVRPDLVIFRDAAGQLYEKRF